MTDTNNNNNEYVVDRQTTDVTMPVNETDNDVIKVVDH